MPYTLTARLPDPDQPGLRITITGEAPTEAEVLAFVRIMLRTLADEIHVLRVDVTP